VRSLFAAPVLLWMVLLTFMRGQAPSFVSRSKNSVFILSHLNTETVLKSLRKALRTGRPRSPSCQTCCSSHEAQQKSDFFNTLAGTFL